MRNKAKLGKRIRTALDREVDRELISKGKDALKDFDERITQLRQAAELGKKRTPPDLDAQVAISDKGNLLVVIDAKNEIP